MAFVFDDLNGTERLTFVACLCLYALSTRYFAYIFLRPTALDLLKSTLERIASSLATSYLCSWDPRVTIPRDVFIYGMYDLFKLVHSGGAPDLEPPQLTLPLIEALVITTTVLGQLERSPLTILTLIGGGVELITVLLIYYWQNPPRADPGSVPAGAVSTVREKELQERRFIKLVFSVALVIVSTMSGMAGLRFISLLSGAALCGALRLYT